METLVTAACVLLGLALGSFANVVIHRVPRGESIVSPPSARPSCGSRVRARHNVPVLSWLWLRGRCADCGSSINARYPLVELLTAVSFGLIGALGGLTWWMPLLLALGFFTIVLSVVDLETRRLPDRIVAPFALAAVLGIAFQALGTGSVHSLGRAGIGALVLGLLYFAAFLAYPRGMGFGDVKLAPVIGGVLASMGWAELAVGGFSAFLWGSCAGVIAMIVQRRRTGVAIPFGPWMLAGCWTGILVGRPVGEWYLTVMGLT